MCEEWSITIFQILTLSVYKTFAAGSNSNWVQLKGMWRVQQTFYTLWFEIWEQIVFTKTATEIRCDELMCIQTETRLVI